MIIKEEHLREISRIIACDDSVLDDLVHETMAVKASNINNEGCIAQAEFLIEEGIFDSLEQILEYVKVCYEDTSD